MSRTKKIPSYRLHKQSGQAIVSLPDGLGNRKDVLLGPFGSAERRKEYARVIGEWEAASRKIIPKQRRGDVTVNELLLRYWEHAKSYYGYGDGKRGDEHCLRSVIRLFREICGHTLAKDFEPLALRSHRELMVNELD